MRTVILHGHLARLCGRYHRFEIQSPGEAIRALCANFPQFKQHLYKAAQAGLRFHVWDGESTIKAEELQMHGTKVIRISPELKGAKKSGALETIIGAVFIVIGTILYFTPGAAAAPYFWEIGASLLLGGVVQLLTPTPRSDGPADKPKSNYFDGPVNVTAQGNPVPILYGEMIVGSAVISAGIEVDDIPLGASPNDAPPVIDYGP